MARKRKSRKKWDRERECGTKHAYNRWGDARAAADRASKRTTRFIAAYRCQWCNRFHIGHPPAAVRQSIIQRSKNRGNL